MGILALPSRLRPTKESRVERFLGPELTAQVRAATKDWYGPPIAIGNVPGEVYAMRGGDFGGPIKSGRYSSLLDMTLAEAYRRHKRATRRARCTAGALSFSSFSDYLSKSSQGGRRRDFFFQKNGATGVVNAASTLWRLGSSPPAGTTPSAAPGGNAPDSTTTGGFPFTNPASGDAQFFALAQPATNVGANTLLLYDRIFHVAKTMNSTGTEAVTGVPTRYQSQTSTDPDYIGGNFIFVETGGTALAATGHNWTVCTYTDQGGAASTLPSMPGNASNIVDRLDMPVGAWFMQLETGDVGVKALTQMQCSALVATGVIFFVIGHPIAFMPCPIANLACTLDASVTPPILARVFDSACLAFLEMPKPATTATVYNGTFTTIQA